MLIRFSVENYRSFYERQIFSMAAGKYSKHKEHLITTNGKRLLKGGLIFGANASGKSNLIEAAWFGKSIVFKGIKNSSMVNRHFRIDPSAIIRPGVLQYDFVINGHIYSYGFAFSYKDCSFVAEWLYLCDDNKEICIFDRVVGEKVSTELNFKNEQNKQIFNIYADGVNDQTSFLWEICSHKLSENEDFISFFDVLEWFYSLVFIFPDSEFSSIGQFYKGGENDSFGRLLHYFDTGIESIVTDVKPLEDVLTFLPEKIKNDVMHDIQEDFDEKNNDVASAVEVTIGGKRFSFSKKEDGTIVGSQLTMNHGNDVDLFDLVDESDGTRRLFDLIPIYQKGKENCVIFVDELDRSFHTKLTVEFLRKFFEKTEGKSSQLIVTLHDSNVMNLNFFRQDEIWFVERQGNHSSEIYSLNKFKERFDSSVSKDYLLGRYGSIPVFGFDNDENEGEE